MKQRIRQFLPVHIQLLIALIVFFVLRFPSLFEPYWYGDEGIYETIGLALRHGRLLYAGIFDNKPPLLYLTYALFSGNQFEVRLLSLVVGLCTVTLFFCLAKRFFQETRLPFILTIIFAVFFGLPLIEGNIANAENFMLFPTLGAVTLLFLAVTDEKRKVKRKRQVLLLLSGALLAVTTLFKVVGVFDMAACGLFLFLIIWLEHDATHAGVSRFMRKLCMDLLPFLTGYGLPLFVTAGYFLVHHAFTQFLQAVLLSNVGYVGYSNTFIIPQGLLILKLLLLFLFLFLCFWKRKSFSERTLFILIWLGFSVFNVFFSQRPYTHYALLVVPSLILSIGTLFSQVEKSRFALISGLGSLLLVGIHFGFYGKTLPYYGNFLSYITGHKTTQAYQTFFDGNTPRDYDVVSFLLTQQIHSLFVWGDSAEIYPLTHTIPPGRYTVAYHITQYKHAIAETEQAFRTHPPEFVVVLPNTSQLPFGLSGYMPLVTFDHTAIYERTNF